MELLAGIAIGGIISWFITHIYYKKSLNNSSALVSMLDINRIKEAAIKYNKGHLEYYKNDDSDLYLDEVYLDEDLNLIFLDCPSCCSEHVFKFIPWQGKKGERGEGDNYYLGCLQCDLIISLPDTFNALSQRDLETLNKIRKKTAERRGESGEIFNGLYLMNENSTSFGTNRDSPSDMSEDTIKKRKSMVEKKIKEIKLEGIKYFIEDVDE